VETHSGLSTIFVLNKSDFFYLFFSNTMLINQGALTSISEGVGNCLAGGGYLGIYGNNKICYF
jgi:hypothetical protein